MDSSYYGNTFRNRSRSNLSRYSNYDSFENNRNFSKNNSIATSMINSIFERLNKERKLLYGAQGKSAPSLPNPANLYSFKNFSSLGHQIMNPYFYSYKFLDPIYYPMEIPGTGRPVDPPRMEMGAPCEDDDDCCCSGGSGITSNELIFLLRSMGRIPKNGPPDLSLLKFGQQLAHHQDQK